MANNGVAETQQFLDDMAECITTLPLSPSRLELVKAAFRTSISYAKAKAVDRANPKSSSQAA